LGKLVKIGDKVSFNCYKNKKVFLTGHTGFKGSWLALWLKSLGADVLGYSLEPNTTPSMFEELKIDEKIKSVSYSEPVMTYETNVIGTLNVLEAARKCSNIKAFVNVTTDKCYENKEVARGYTENEPMGGHDMYSSSKGCVEIMSSSFRRSFLQGGKPYAMATARAGNVIGGGDWAQDRLIPDCIQFINADKPIEIRNPIAVRPWQHVLEPLSGYLLLGKQLLENGAKYAEGFNFGPAPESVLTVADVAQRIVGFYQKGEVLVSKKDDLHEAGLLMLNIEKAHDVLGWKPVYNADEAIKTTVNWYKSFYNGEKMFDFTLNQIKDYQNRISYRGAKSETVISKIS